MPTTAPFTTLLDALTGGNRTVVDAVLPHVYDALRALAHQKLRGERADHTLNTTALVHEAYEKLVEQDRMTWQNRAHFMGVAALSMRRILINYAHKRNAQKRGGGAPVATFEDGMAPRDVHAADLIDLDDALQRLEELNERQAQVVTYRFFGGLTQKEIAEVIGVSVPTVRRDWRLARAWLSREMKPPAPDAKKDATA
ncbi:sigma-70 family RNA polymerase sigma factor [Salisaeta longa]|uniref:sigma-70 family RNA polymerase sigma factor n=1 Tax=Salisaeta longa TaxID=503170 RepID=UPI0003B3C79D|nr:sigma-70 family RNA polymerase sigma factor [Salisaeta longa]